MTTFSDVVYHMGGVPVGGKFTQGNSYFIKPGSGGSNGNTGRKPAQALSTVANALSKMTADQNDVAYLLAQDNSASGTTDYQSSALDWNKDLTHIVGVASGGRLGSRARIAQLSTATGVAPLMTWSASSGSMQNVHVFHGVDDATSVGCFNVTGERNYFRNCHFGGIGHATQDVANNYSLRVSGDENLFEDCVIGIDTIGRGSAANSEILFAGQATRNVFRNCVILTFADANTHQFITFGAASLDRFVLFENCAFINPIQSTATTMTEAIDGDASAGGLVLLRNCTLIGATDWEGATTVTYIDGGAPTAGTSGLAVAVA